jgi:hypothetical protein
LALGVRRAAAPGRLGRDEGASAVAIDGSGRIVVAGRAVGGSGRDQFALARYHTDGTQDTAFGDDGTVLLDFATSVSGQANAIAIQADGKILLAGGAALIH